MYKVTYYMGGSNLVVSKCFNTLSEATQFANKQPLNTVLEVKYYPKENKRENRT